MAQLEPQAYFLIACSALSCIHAANNEGRKIALHNFFFACFFAAEHLPRNLSLSLLRSLLILWTYSGDRAVDWKTKLQKKHRNQNEKINSAQTDAPIF